MLARSGWLTRPVALLASSAVLVAACGGSSATPSPAAPTATSSPAATATPTPAPAASAAASGADLSGLTGAASALDKLSSYRFSLQVSGTDMGTGSSGQSGTFSMDGTVVLKPEKALQITMKGLGGETGNAAITYTIVGGKVYMDLGGTAMELPADQVGSIEQTFESFSPQQVFGQTFDKYLGGLTQVGEEQKNGVTTLHLRADPQTLDALSQQYGATAGAGGDWSMDVWVAKDGGYMVSAVTKGSYTAGSVAAEVLVSIDISGIDDPANKVVAPA